MKSQALNIREMCQVGIFAAIIAVCAQLSIPMPVGVPMTLQTIAVSLAGVVLGPKKGAVAALVYLLLGAVGMPVFAGFQGGIGIVFGRTGGFILSFPLMALTAGIGAVKGKGWLAFWLVIGAAVNFACGMLMFGFVTGTPLAPAFFLVVAPFLPISAVEIIVLTMFGHRLRGLLRKNGI